METSSIVKSLCSIIFIVSYFLRLVDAGSIHDIIKTCICVRVISQRMQMQRKIHLCADWIFVGCVHDVDIRYHPETAVKHAIKQK